MLAHLPEECGREPALSEEIEHRDGAIMAGRIVGRAGELVASLSIGHPLPALPVGQDAELAEPPRHNRPKLGVRREPQKAVSLPQLTVLVPAAHDEGVAESLVGERDRHHVERVIRVHQQPASVTPAARRYVSEPTGDAPGVEEHG